jgi:hypothetical protein
MVLMKVEMDLPSGPRQVIHQASTRNLKLTIEREAEDLASSAAGPGSEPGKGDEALCPSWALEGGEPGGEVKREPAFKDLVADHEKAIKVLYLRARIVLSLQALYESMPTYGDKDLVVVHRKTDKGVWRGELWTNRAFEKLELQLGPWATQLKETHLMACGHAVVGLPRHGRGAHPENQGLALDGRGRSMMAAKGSIDEQEHRGSFFWMVTRTPKAAEANLSTEGIAFEATVKLSLPAPKRRKVCSVSWEEKEMPTLPILVNQKAIEKHTKPLVYLAPKEVAKTLKKKEGTTPDGKKGDKEDKTPGGKEDKNSKSLREGPSKSRKAKGPKTKAPPKGSVKGLKGKKGASGKSLDKKKPKKKDPKHAKVTVTPEDKRDGEKKHEDDKKQKEDEDDKKPSE